MNSELANLIKIRNYRTADHAFIMATFLRGLYYGDSWFSLIPKDRFMNAYKKFAEAIILSPKNTVRLAVLKEDEDVILGYSILSLDNKTVHWVFVKAGDKDESKSWRKKGLARVLVPSNPECVTHLTALGKSLLYKLPGCVFDPFNI